MRTGERIYRPHPRAAFRTIGADVVIVHTVSSRLVRLNETGSAIWERLDGRTVDQIAAELVELFEVSPEQAERETVEFLEHLLERSLVELSEGQGQG